MADPKIPEDKLFKQGQIYGRASTTDDTISEIAPDYRGHGATPQEKTDDNKSWISKDSTDTKFDDSSRPQPDIYAQAMNKRLGPLASVQEKIGDGVEAAMNKFSGSSNSVTDTAGETKDSASGKLSEYTNAAWEKISSLAPTVGANEPPKEQSTLDLRMTEVSNGHTDNSAIADQAKEKSSSMSDVGHKLLAAGGDDVLKVLADGASTQDDPLKANMRAATELLE